ncbi:MAG: NAD(P)-binding protein, partial [Terriglobales bacterium]
MPQWEKSSFAPRQFSSAMLPQMYIAPSMAAREDQFDFDFIVIGSGFGGSVSAWRLVEKGYRVAVMEMGRRWT